MAAITRIIIRSPAIIIPFCPHVSSGVSLPGKPIVFLKPKYQAAKSNISMKMYEDSERPNVKDL